MALTWKDNLCREYSSKITVGITDDVRDATGLDLTKIMENKGELWRTITDDPAILCNVMFQLAKFNNSDAFTMTEKEFKNGIDGDTIEAMVLSLEEAITDFFRPGKRETFQRVMQKTKDLEAKAMTEASKALDKVDLDALAAGLGDKMDAVVKEAVATAVSSTKSPDVSQ